MAEKKSLKDWWNEKSKNQKYLIIGGGIVLLMIMGSLNNKNNSSSESDNTSYTPNRQVEFCAYCGKEITGSGTEQFGKKYCDVRCYADAN
jgi:hypothetical protein